MNKTCILVFLLQIYSAEKQPISLQYNMLSLCQNMELNSKEYTGKKVEGTIVSGTKILLQGPRIITKYFRTYGRFERPDINLVPHSYKAAVIPT